MKINKVNVVVRWVRVIAMSCLVLSLVACDNDDNNNVTGQQQNAASDLGPNGQVERLARPAINEGLILNNDLLNIFNTVPPTADLSPAAAPILAEATITLDAFDAVDGKEDISPSDVVKGFLPDVMRIDTSLSIPVGQTAYNAATSGDKGMLIGGRKIEDDVIDITLSLLVAGDPTGQAVKDNVSYQGVSGNVAQPGHKLLNGQSSVRGSADFPFLASPN